MEKKKKIKKIYYEGFNWDWKVFEVVKTKWEKVK